MADGDGFSSASLVSYPSVDFDCTRPFEFYKINAQTGDGDEVLEPVPRSGHRIVADEGNIYSLGGYNPDFWEVENTEDTIYPLFKELWRFNIASRKWTKLKTSGYMPTELASHAVLLHGDLLLLFGGTGIPFGEATSNVLHYCNLKTFQWTSVTCSGDPPQQKYGHTMTLVGNYLYVVGGTTGWQYNSDVHRLHMENFVWEKFEVQEKAEPVGRYRHEVVSDGKKLFVFGGGTSQSVDPFDKLPTFDLESHKWDIVMTTGDPVYRHPAPRKCHSCVNYKGVVYMCGGYDDQQIFGDLWKISLDTFTWTKMHANMIKPAYFHSSALLTQSGRMVTYGGVVNINHMERTSDIYCIWLRVPSLREMCWSKVTNTVRNIDHMTREQLLELGIPYTFLKRICFCPTITAA